MKIRSVSTSGLGGRKRKNHVDLHEDVNVFWGVNGSGKTSLLKTLHAGLIDSTVDLEELRLDSARITIQSQVRGEVTRELQVLAKGNAKKNRAQNRLLLDRRNELLRRAESRSLSETEEAVLLRELETLELRSAGPQLSWKSEPDNAEGRNFSHQYLPISRAIVASRNSRSTRREPTEADYDKAFATAIRDRWKEYQYRQVNEVRQIQERGLAAVFNSVIDRTREGPRAASDVDASQAYEFASDFFSTQRIDIGISKAQFVESYDRDNVLRGVVGEILEVERQTAEAREPVRKIEEIISDLFIGEKEVNLEEDVQVNLGGESIPLESLSSGEKQLIFILLETIRAGDNCIIIDEPEISMHVDWQHRLIETMRTVNPGVQIILATHSPEILAGVPERSIFEL